MMDEKYIYKNKTAHRQGHAHTTGYGYDKTRRLDVAIYSLLFVFFVRSKRKAFLRFNIELFPCIPNSNLSKKVSYNYHNCIRKQQRKETF